MFRHQQDAQPAHQHLLYVLLDSNLPTGGFVASSGLESWAKHGFLYHDPSLHPSSFASASSSSSSSRPRPRPRRPPGQTGAALGVADFARAEVRNYARTTNVFVRGAHAAVAAFADANDDDDVDVDATGCGSRTGIDTRATLARLVELDQTHDACLLSSVSRRASRAQGVAMLTLYTKGLTPPAAMGEGDAGRAGTDTGVGVDGEQEGHPDSEASRQARARTRARALIDAYKLAIRRGGADGPPGHLAVCWGAMTAALGLSLETALHLHLFLHARSLLSAAVRLNLIGPYLSSQLLLHPFEGIIASASASREGESVGRAGSGGVGLGAQGEGEGGGEGEFYKRTRPQPPSNHVDTDVDTDDWAWTTAAERGPATTWPLGELLTSRHDLQHSRIFNS